MAFNTVIFDFGGVITSSPFEAFNRMEAERGLPRDFVRKVNSTDPDNNA
ncbi:MAG: HAD family hydrolase, partial [Sphingorhabdus lacus]